MTFLGVTFSFIVLTQDRLSVWGLVAFSSWKCSYMYWLWSLLPINSLFSFSRIPTSWILDILDWLKYSYLFSPIFHFVFVCLCSTYSVFSVFSLMFYFNMKSSFLVFFHNTLFFLGNTISSVDSTGIAITLFLKFLFIFWIVCFLKILLFWLCFSC